MVVAWLLTLLFAAARLALSALMLLLCELSVELWLASWPLRLPMVFWAVARFLSVLK
jgi:hypothetical protein